MTAASPIVATGTFAFDKLETPAGKRERILGGAANHFAIAASIFSPVSCVSVVGGDFPEEHLKFLNSRDVKTDGIEVKSEGKTFFWSGYYGEDLSQAHTRITDLNVFETFEPKVPEADLSSQYVFLGNLSPVIQKSILRQMPSRKLAFLDSMNFWIESAREDLIEAIRMVDVVILNEGEIKQLSGKSDVIEGARDIASWGPKIVIAKRGEYGAFFIYEGEIRAVPAYLGAEVVDPTGAGDTFAGGMFGYLVNQLESGEELSADLLHKSMVIGTLTASFQVEGFGFEKMVQVTKNDISERLLRFKKQIQAPENIKL